MKKFIFLFLLLPLWSLAQKSNPAGFTVKGNIKGLTENSVVTLTNFNDDTDTTARTLVKKGTFTLVGTVNEPNIYQVNFHDAQKKFLLFMGNESITLEGDVANLQATIVNGSPIHKDFSEFQASFTPLVTRLSQLNQQVASTPNLQRGDSIMITYNDHVNKIRKTIDDFIDNKKNSPVAPFVILVTSEIEGDLSVVEKRFDKLTPSQKGGFYGKILETQIADAKIGAIGSDAIPFIQEDTLGKPVSLSSFRGKYVLVDFWASWSQPCRMENPNVVNAYDRFRNKNFTVLGVSLDRSKENWMKAIHDDNLSWTHVSDLKYWNNEVAQKYRVRSIPQNFLIGPDGKIVGRDLRGSELVAKLCELLGCD